MMEKAIFVSRIANLKYVTGEYTRLYFGAEFCENLIPSREDADSVLRFVSEKGMDLTLVTPFVTNKGMERLKSAAAFILGRMQGAEIVVNDWGALHWLSMEYARASLVLGRLLTKQKRGPRILNLAGRVPAAMIEHFQRSSADGPLLSGFLSANGITRIEFDNLLQGVARSGGRLKGSLYFPYAYVTTTRFCLTASHGSCGGAPLRAVPPCRKECLDKTFTLRHKQMPVELLLKGNTQFFKNERVPDDLSRLNIDRTVYQPEIP
jgi:hypothetical protein